MKPLIRQYPQQKLQGDGISPVSCSAGVKKNGREIRRNNMPAADTIPLYQCRMLTLLKYSTSLAGVSGEAIYFNFKHSNRDLFTHRALFIHPPIFGIAREYLPKTFTPPPPPMGWGVGVWGGQGGTCTCTCTCACACTIMFSHTQKMCIWLFLP